MATILLNSKVDDLKTTVVKGNVSFSHSIDYDRDKQAWIDAGIIGELITHTYCDDIQSIETDRFLIPDCTVISESFGSADFNIVYKFIANECTVLPDPLTEEEIKKFEEEAYAYEKTDKFLYGIKDLNGDD